jgi:hypothetical protein
MFRTLLAYLQEALHKRHLLCLCQLVATRTVMEMRSTPTLVAAKLHKKHAIYQVSFLERFLKMSKLCSKHVEALNS